jgi:hypothetical protein
MCPVDCSQNPIKQQKRGFATARSNFCPSQKTWRGFNTPSTEEEKMETGSLAAASVFAGSKRVLIAAASVVAFAAAAQAQLFDFTVVPSQSGLGGSLSLNVPTTGTLIGNWDAATNPTGTRTKPGIFGTFGPTENVAVPSSVGLRSGGPINSSASGSFRLSLAPGNATAQMTGYNTNFLNSGPVALPITLTLLFDSFRTRAPDSTYPGGIPLPIPFGEASLTQLSLLQVGGGAGSLKETGPGQYDFFITPIVQLTAEFQAMGNPFLIPGVPVAFPLQGQVTVTGNTAVLSSIRPLEFNQQQAVNQPLPQLPLDLPTVFPAGGTANLLMDLTVGTVTSELEGTVTTFATGVLVPSPGASAVLLAGLALWRRRR